MFGADAPAYTWQMTFEHAALANPPLNFVQSDIPGGALVDGHRAEQPGPAEEAR